MLLGNRWWSSRGWRPRKIDWKVASEWQENQVIVSVWKSGEENSFKTEGVVKSLDPADRSRKMKTEMLPPGLSVRLLVTFIHPMYFSWVHNMFLTLSTLNSHWAHKFSLCICGEEGRKKERERSREGRREGVRRKRRKE